MGNGLNKEDTDRQRAYFKKNSYEKIFFSEEDLMKLHKKVLKEYPWLQDVSDSVLVTDNNLKDNPIVKILLFCEIKLIHSRNSSGLCK